VSLPEDADFDDRVLLGANPERDAFAPGPDQFNWDLINVFLRGMGAQHTALQQLLDDDPDAALLCNSLFVGAWPVALGAPGRRFRTWVSAVANPINVADDATTATGPAGTVAANRLANDGFYDVLEPSRLAAQGFLDEVGGSIPMPSFYEAMYRLPDAVAALTVPEFDFPRVTPPPALTYAGILPPRPAADRSRPPWWHELDGDQPVVVVTQGTLANTDLGQLVEPALLALADEKVLVVAALGRSGGLGIDVPGNARVAEYVPFDELLPLADVLITNGGFGGTQQALAAGVPVVICGTTEEKPMTAARVAYHRVGIDLQTANPAPEQLQAAVTAILDDPDYRAAAARLRDAYAAYDPMAVVAGLLS
jgi:hypothetical protein